MLFTCIFSLLMGIFHFDSKYRVPTYFESQVKSGNFASGQGKFRVLYMFFSSCIIIVTFFNPSSIVACLGKSSGGEAD